jgi:hypothetical protein
MRSQFEKYFEHALAQCVEPISEKRLRGHVTTEQKYRALFIEIVHIVVTQMKTRF